MAECNEIIERIEKLVPQVVEECVGYNLNISPEEASFLYRILMKVGGDPDYSLRRHADSLLKTMREAGVVDKFRVKELDMGHIRFKNGGFQ